ncbi:MAG: alpha-amylase family glycosyl hydrolase [bacterium]|nr:alpha-amylase family glycosyl hydrolase [bacterium]
MNIVKKVVSASLCMCLTITMFGCSPKDSSTAATKKVSYKYNHELNMIDDKYRNYYEVFLSSYCDSDGDGIGDINGLISKLDYINDGDDKTDTDLGYTGIWLMPIMPSPSYHKYNVTDYYSVDQSYGTIDEFKHLVEECHKRGIQLIIDLVVNHTSSDHPWFKQATKYLESIEKESDVNISDCKYVQFYNFKYKTDQGGYAQVGNSNWYYECNFDVGMPDLNLSNPEVREEIKKIIDYWMAFGIDGFRLDGVKEYYSGGTEQNTEMVGFISDYVHSKKKNSYVVAEAWQDFYTVIQYYRSNVDSMFNFDFSQIDGAIASNLLAGDGMAFADDMVRIQNNIQRVNKNAIDAEFFTNHDTVRAASFLSYTPEKIKLAAGMNLMMTGTTFTYYGEEIGMTGSGTDPNKRAPMYWNDDGLGMTVGPPTMEKQENHFESAKKQQQDDNSIYNYYKRALRIRNENPEIARGKIEKIDSVTDKNITAITKVYNESKLVLLYNLSKDTKQVLLNKKDLGYSGIQGYLTVNGEEVTVDGENVTLPPYAIAILK